MAQPDGVDKATDPGWNGIYSLVEIKGSHAIINIKGTGEDETCMDIVVKDIVGPMTTGTVRTLEIDFRTRSCVLELQHDGMEQTRANRTLVRWMLDIVPTACPDE